MHISGGEKKTKERMTAFGNLVVKGKIRKKEKEQCKNLQNKKEP